MMHVYDVNHDGKLDREELFKLGIDVMEDKISDAKINRVVREL
jgi:Ca2+-binding EF-hand superfamily protein